MNFGAAERCAHQDHRPRRVQWQVVESLPSAFVKTQLQSLIEQGLSALRTAGVLPAELANPEFVIERPKERAHGDFSSNVAMLLVKHALSPVEGAKKPNPRALAQQLVDAIPASDMIAKVDIAGPGFINFHLTPAAWQRQVRDIHAAGAAFGRSTRGSGHTVGVEYVSANPTGPLHVGHGRAGVIGDCIARVLAANGWDVKREYYYNDAGVQIENLAKSVQARARGFKPGDAEWPAEAYNGDYIAEVAASYLRGDTVAMEGHTITGSNDADAIDAIRAFAVAYLRREQNDDLAAFGVAFDRYFLESSLYADGKVEETVNALIANGHTYEEGGALWLRSTTFGDDKDRVMRKSDGNYTYFVPDVAYHLSKWQRGYRRAVTELGADHHGSLARVKAGLQALDCGIPAGYPDYVLHQMVTVMRGGEEVKLSKRAGSYLTLRDLIDEAGCDATRWFLIARKPDSQLTFDIDLARSQSNDNPVYYVQYAHARVCSLLRQAVEKGYSFDPANGDAHLVLLDDAPAQELMRELSRYPEVVEAASAALEPHLVAQYLRELANAFHGWYHASPVLVADAARRDARLTLALATRQVLANGLDLLGVSAPESM